MYDLDPASPLRAMLKRHEGFRAHPYRCPAGFLTVGYGRNLEAQGLSRAEAEYLLDSDIRAFADELHRVLPWTAGLDSVRFDALVDMTFNLGMGGLLAFHKFLRYLQAGDYPLASIEVLDSTWADQVGDRARELSAMILEGRYVEGERRVGG